MSTEIKTEQDYIDAVYAECLNLDQKAIGLTLHPQIRAHSIVTYRFLKDIERRLDAYLARIKALEKECSQ